MDKGISEIVGRGELQGEGSRQVYRALRSLLCSTCGGEMTEGSLFTRRKVKGIGVSIMPQCQKCAPFILQAGKKKEKSALLRSLLAERPADSTTQASVSSEALSTAQAEEKSLDEAVRRRLGPALKRGRHKRTSG